MGDPLDRLRIDRASDDRDSPWRRRLLLLGIATVMVAVAAWWGLSRASGIPVDTAAVREGGSGSGAVASVLDASGYVVARRQATVSSKITGRLVAVDIEEGMSVSSGQMLARLDDANARHALELALARQVAAETSLKEVEVRL